MQQYGKKLEAFSDDAVKRDVPSEQLKAALAEANIYVFRQDADLRYIWVSGPPTASDSIIGHTDDELLPSNEREAVVAIKRRVLQTGVPADCEASYALPEGRRLFALHVHPVFG